MRQDVGIGVISLRRMEVRPFTPKQIALLETFADQAVIAIENARLFQELEGTRTMDLAVSLEQQTATSARSCGSSRHPRLTSDSVLQTVAENAARLCDASDAMIRRVDRGELRMAANYGPMVLSRETLPIDRQSVSGHAAVDRRTIHVPIWRPFRMNT